MRCVRYLFYPVDQTAVAPHEQSERVLPLRVWAVPERERALRGGKEEALSVHGEQIGGWIFSSVLIISA